MDVNEALVDRLSGLAKLRFEKSEKVKIATDLGNILALVEKLNEVDTEGVEPLVYLNEDINILRQDQMHHEVSKQDALKNAPKKDSDYFKVPKVIQ